MLPTHWRYWALGSAIALLALFAVFTSSPGWYVTDNRFEHFWSPGRMLVRATSLWDSQRSLGGPRGELALAYGLVLAGLRAFGTSPAVAERLLHVLLLVTGGMGMVALLRALRPGFGTEHVVAGLFYSFNPYSAVFLIPSGLFVHYALAPWLVLAFVSGVTGSRPWRWAAVFALVVGASGTLDPPGLAFSLVLLVPTAVYLVLIDGRRRWIDVVRWLVGASCLTIVVSAASLVQLSAGSASLAARLFGTESVEAVHRTSSWAESWRGLGFWPSYFPDQIGLLRQHHAAYLDHPAVVFATFVPGIVALAAFGWLRWRPRLLLVGVALLSLTMMVGTFPPADPLPLGQLLAEAYRRFPGLTAMRTGYKAGAGLAIGVGGLLGLTVAVVGSRLHGRWLRALPLVAAVALIGVISFPFWTGKVYSGEDRMRGVPPYWSEALTWLEGQPGSTRALILPGTSNSRYRWGSPGDDIFDALLGRPHMVYTNFPQSTPHAFDVERAIDGYVQSGGYEAGTLAPIAQRLGIEYVVVRNDLDWQRLRRARPAMLQGLREDPDLDLVATFGRPGEYVVASGDQSAEGLSEADLKPVEIFRVGGVEATSRLVPVHAPLVVAGDGDAWPPLAAEGLLDEGRPIRYSGDADAGELAGVLNQGAPVVITDTNRRRVSVLTRFGKIDSQVLAPEEDVGRPSTNLFDLPGTETVAVFTDAHEVASTGTGEGVAGYEPWYRPANAFDGDPTTSWLTGALEDPVGTSVSVEFKTPVELSAIRLVAAAQEGSGRSISAVRLRFSDGTTELVDLSAGSSDATFAPRRTDTLEVRIEAVAGAGLGRVGLSEITMPSLDLVEVFQVPDDLFRAAETDASLERALLDAEVGYLFERFRGNGPVPVERALRRRFRTSGTRVYSLEGNVVVGTETPDAVVDALIGDDLGAYGTTRLDGALEGRGGLAVDGRQETGWVAPARAGSELTVRFPRRVVDRVELTTPVAGDRSSPKRLMVKVAGMEHEMATILPGGCATSSRAQSAPTCVGGAVVTFPSITTDHVTIEVVDVERRSAGAGLEAAPFEISEVVLGPAGQPPADEDSRRCTPGVVSIGKRDVPVRRLGSVDDLLAGKPVRFEACDASTLGPGWHDIATTGGTPIERVALTSVLPSIDRVFADPLEVSADHGGSRTLMDVPVPEAGGTLVAGHAYDPGWTASVDGRDLGPPVPLDAQVGWTLPEAGNQTVELEYRPQRRYDRALALSWTGLAVCVWLVFRRSHR